MKQIALLGGTGSIGDSTLDVIARHPERFRLRSVSGYRNLKKLLGICQRFAPAQVVVPDEQAALALRHALLHEPAEAVEQRRGKACNRDASWPEIMCGSDGLDRIASDPAVDVVVAAIVGAAGLSSCLAAARAGKVIALANKEALVMSGSLLSELCQSHGAQLLPLDSEHNAVFQCLPCAAISAQEQGGLSTIAGRNRFGVEAVTLTASGGPFRSWTFEQMQSARVDEAIKHPNWQMGQKISVDSASLMNKGLELIEAQVLFGLSPERLQVLIHPQSIVHAMVQYKDGSVLAQMGTPDMRTPIAQVLGWIEGPAQRITSGVGSLDLAAIGRLDFESPDLDRFPALGLAMHAMRMGGNAACVLNAANEVAVAGFLAKRCRFTDIARCVHAVLAKMANSVELHTLAAILETDLEARR
ncbi:MAG: 1-deoxy-D-xylulose-5-phosphate reductoisomerase, partial [Betaproteobacteria bacterium]|nr:1-deoxy-D-xylulose-5-phosphate reductoisomerase [Betaproteobacteria bacterium]